MNSLPFCEVRRSALDSAIDHSLVECGERPRDALGHSGHLVAKCRQLMPGAGQRLMFARRATVRTALQEPQSPDCGTPRLRVCIGGTEQCATRNTNLQPTRPAPRQWRLAARSPAERSLLSRKYSVTPFICATCTGMRASSLTPSSFRCTTWTPLQLSGSMWSLSCSSRFWATSARRCAPDSQYCACCCLNILNNSRSCRIDLPAWRACERRRDRCGPIPCNGASLIPSAHAGSLEMLSHRALGKCGWFSRTLLAPYHGTHDFQARFGTIGLHLGNPNRSRCTPWRKKPSRSI
jgi:hypothetical protein